MDGEKKHGEREVVLGEQAGDDGRIGGWLVEDLPKVGLKHRHLGVYVCQSVCV